jgi:hypothetical protein
MKRRFYTGIRPRFKKDRSTTIYFIRSVQGGPVKIGITDDLPSRLRTLQTAHAYPLTVIYSFRGRKSDEKMIHKALSNYRLNGEWFESEPVLEYIERHKRHEA